MFLGQQVHAAPGEGFLLLQDGGAQRLGVLGLVGNELGAGQRGVGAGARDLGIKRVGVEGRGAGAAEP